MHEITRHSIHVSEVLTVTIATLEKLTHVQRYIYDSLPDVLSKSYREQALEYVNFQLQMARSLRERSISNHERLKSEITVVRIIRSTVSIRKAHRHRDTIASPNRTTG
jgi:hypothetical protein